MSRVGKMPVAIPSGVTVTSANPPAGTTPVSGDALSQSADGVVRTSTLSHQAVAEGS